MLSLDINMAEASKMESTGQASPLTVILLYLWAIQGFTHGVFYTSTNLLLLYIHPLWTATSLIKAWEGGQTDREKRDVIHYLTAYTHPAFCCSTRVWILWTPDTVTVMQSKIKLGWNHDESDVLGYNAELRQRCHFNRSRPYWLNSQCSYTEKRSVVMFCNDTAVRIIKRGRIVGSTTSLLSREKYQRASVTRGRSPLLRRLRHQTGIANDHWFHLAEKSRSRERNMQGCLQVQRPVRGSRSHTVRHAHSHSNTFALLHLPKLPKLAKASCLGGTTAGLTECERPIPTPGTPTPPIITGVVMPIFMLMFIPIMPWFAGIPPIPMVPVVIEGGMPVAIDAGMPIVMAPPAIMGLAGGLRGVTWGGELRFSPPKFWANRLTGGTPADMNRDELETWVMKPWNCLVIFVMTHLIPLTLLIQIPELKCCNNI